MFNNEIVKLGSVLFLVTFTVALLLALGNLATADRIEQLNIKLQEEAQKEALPAAESFEEVSFEKIPDNVNNVFKGIKNGETVGYCVSVTSQGFGGDIEMIVGADTTGKITGVNIVEFQETPGLGSKAGEDKFLVQYVDKLISDTIKVIKTGSAAEDEISAISGSTITSKAVTDGVNSASEVLRNIIGE